MTTRFYEDWKNDKGHAVVKLGLQEHTNYYFDCKPAALHGALDRFSQFFVAPLCKADALEREVNAVDNEFSGALPGGRAAVLHPLLLVRRGALQQTGSANRMIIEWHK